MNFDDGAIELPIWESEEPMGPPSTFATHPILPMPLQQNGLKISFGSLAQVGLKSH